VQQDFKVAPFLCYEIAYSSLVRNFAKQADFLLTISNDAWFGRSIGPHQHMQIAQVRALETGRALIRATNTGITAIVNANGQITHQLNQFESDVLFGEIEGLNDTTQ